MNQVIVIGAGGHARSVLDAIDAGGTATACAVLEKSRQQWGQRLMGVPIVGGDELIPRLVQAGANGFVIALAAVGESQLRRTLFERCQNAGLPPFSVMHPASIRSRYARLEPGVQVLAQAVVNAESSVGANTVINTGAIVEHDCVIGRDVHLAPRSCLAGGVKIGDGTHIGLGAVVRENISIGSGAVIGAGAVVIDDVPDGATYVGVPARPIVRSAA